MNIDQFNSDARFLEPLNLNDLTKEERAYQDAVENITNHLRSQRKKLEYKPRKYIKLTAYWGNSDAESSIRLSQRQWNGIKNGKRLSVKAKGWYEGKSQLVHWNFSSREVSIDGEDGMQCLINESIASLIVELVESQQRK